MDFDHEVEVEDGVAWVKVCGRLDGESAPEMEAAGSKIVGSVTSVALDMSGIDYISSAGLRSLLVVAKKSQAAGGKLVLCAPSEMVMDVLEIAGFDKIFKIAANSADAKAMF